MKILSGIISSKDANIFFVFFVALWETIVLRNFVFTLVCK